MGRLVLAVGLALLLSLAVRADIQVVGAGHGTQDAVEIDTGPDGICNTAAAHGTDDDRNIAVGLGTPNTAVIRCGGNKIPETHANNAVLPGLPLDDVQVTPVDTTPTCGSKNTVVVNAGPDGISNTRAEGPDLVLAVLKPLRVLLHASEPTASKTIRFAVANVEFGSAAPAARAYTIAVSDGSCPSGTVSLVDADSSTPGLQAGASVPRGGKVRGSFVVTLSRRSVTTASRLAPFRCAVSVEADAGDSPSDPDDAGNGQNNSIDVDLEVVDPTDVTG